MKISEITLSDVKKYLHVYDDEDDMLINGVMSAAKAYITGYTGLSEVELDNHEDISIAFLCLCSDMYDVRAVILQSNRISAGAPENPTVKVILGMHSVNLL